MSKKKILIVEDEEALVRLESFLLASRGYQVMAVSDGKAALDCIASMKPDLVLLDIMLPEIDGYEVCRQIKCKDETRHIPVIMLTARKSREDMERGMQVGADSYMVKPFQSFLLVETVKKFLSGAANPVYCSPQ